MATFTVWMLQKSDVTVSGGGDLSGITQGDGSHLVGRTITLNNNNWLQTTISDNDTSFDDNDTGQTLSGAQTISGVTYASGTRVEAEYRLTLTDPATGTTYQAFGYNVTNSNPAYATIEGLAFLGGEGNFPPIGAALQVTAAFEGPGSSGQPAAPYDTLSFPPCLTPGTRIRTPDGDRPVETLHAGDLVLTRDAGAQPIAWIGAMTVSPARLRQTPAFRPVRIAAGALGPGLPARDLLVSPQHRMLVSDWRAELLFGRSEVLVAAKHLIDGRGITLARDLGSVTYLHLMFDAHHVIWAEGAETESFHPQVAGAAALPTALVAELHSLFPALRDHPASYGATARTCLRGWEAATLVA